MESSENKKIDEYIDEFFVMKKGEIIKNPREKIFFLKNTWISRQSLKHIVEQRSTNNGFDVDRIKLLLKKAQGVLIDPDVFVKNNNIKYPASWLFGKFDPEINNGIIVVVDYPNKNEAWVITIYIKEVSRFFKMT